jgi:hypothetical protein
LYLFSFCLYAYLYLYTAECNSKKCNESELYLILWLLFKQNIYSSQVKIILLLFWRFCALLPTWQTIQCHNTKTIWLYHFSNLRSHRSTSVTNMLASAIYLPIHVQEMPELNLAKDWQKLIKVFPSPSRQILEGIP